MTKTRQVLMAEFIQSYRQTAQALFKIMQTALQDHPDCNSGYLPILKALKLKGPLSQHAIATELFHSDAAISRQVAVLIEKKYVTAETDPDNRRLVMVDLTAQGREMLADVEKTVMTYVATLLKDLPDHRLEQLSEANAELQTIITAQLGKDSNEKQ